MSDLVDVASAPGPSRFTRVQQLKKKYDASYHPATDFYKSLRDQIKLTHQNGGSSEELDKVFSKISEKKYSHYSLIINGYKRWWRNREFLWFEPPSMYWTSRTIGVNINPELGLVIDDTNFVIKLYFKAEKLTRFKINAMNALMKEHLADVTPEGTIMAILDPRRSILFHYDNQNHQQLIQSLTGELAYISTVWG